MSVSTVSAARIAGLEGRGQRAREFHVGDRIELAVLKRLGAHRYLTSLQGTQRIIESFVQLTVGSTVKATVTAIGEKLELRYVSSDAVASVMEEHEAGGEDALAELEARYAVELRPDERAAIQQALRVAEDANVMAASAFFLSKLSLPVDVASLQAVYQRLQWSEPKSANAVAVGAVGVDPEDGSKLALSIDATLNDRATDEATRSMMAFAGQEQSLTLASDAHADRKGERPLAELLLNEQDDGSVGYRYGTLPVLIGDQLVELDLVYFRERRGPEQPGGVKRLVMTCKTAALGRIEVLAQSFEDRLSISFKSDSAEAVHVLEQHAEQVRELTARLGWNAEAVSYRFESGVDRAARHIVDHVLNADTLSRLV